MSAIYNNEMSLFYLMSYITKNVLKSGNEKGKNKETEDGQCLKHNGLLLQ